MNKAYFRYLFRSHRSLILFFLVLYLCISLMWSAASGAEEGFGFFASANGAIGFSVLLTWILPVLLFSFVHRRSSADMYLSLPISRRQQRITSIAFAFVISFGYYLITILAAWLLYGVGTVRLLNLALLIGYAAFAILTLLAVHSFIFLIANNWIDGIVLLAAYSFFVLIAFITEGMVADNLIAGMEYGNSQMVWLLSPLNAVIHNYEYLLARNGWIDAELRPLYLLASVIYLAAGWFGTKQEFDHRKSERAEMISDHPLAYPTVINLYAFTFLLLFSSTLVRYRDPGILLFYVLLLGCYVGGTFLYQRKLAVSWKTILLFCGEALLSLVIMIAGWNTYGFRKAVDYSLSEGDTLVYDYFGNVYSNDLGKECTDYDYSVSVSFVLNLPTADLEQNKAVLDVIEAHRIDRIHAYYARIEEDRRRSLNVRNESHGSCFNQFFYSGIAPFTEEELKLISKYCEVWVNDYNHDDWEETQFELNEYLKLRS